MNWLRMNWRWSALNLFAVSTFVFVLTQGSTDWSRTDTFDPGLESGKWAIRFLLACLTITPLNTFFGWKGAIKLRKSAGLWTFGFASVHVLLYIREAKLNWLTPSMPFYLALGLTGMVILTALAATSNRWSMQWLGRNWKRLHRLVYFAGIAVVTHAILATTMSKKVMVRDPQAVGEIKIYIAVLAALLVVRLPLVRQWLIQIPGVFEHYRKSSVQAKKAEGTTGLWPEIQGRESGVSLKPTFIIPNEISKPSEWSNSDNSLGITKGILEVDGENLPERELEVQ